MLTAIWQQNDKKAHILIWTFSAIVFLAVTILDKLTLNVSLGFNPHIFALLSAIVNSLVSVMLVAGLVLIRQKKFMAHKKVMLTTMALSILFWYFILRIISLPVKPNLEIPTTMDC